MDTTTTKISVMRSTIPYSHMLYLWIHCAVIWNKVD